MKKSAGPERVLPLLEALSDEPLEPVELSAHPSDELEGVRATPRFLERAPIGSGGLGEVVEAFDLDLRRVVALKRLRTDRGSPEDVARLVAEAQITAQLEHPNIPPVHSVGVDDEGRPYFTMTRVRGASLTEVIHRAHQGDRPWAEIGLGQMLRIFLRVAYALAAAHARGVLHRDLKPDNIMVGAFGDVRLMDWGIAKVLDRSDRRHRGEPSLPPIDLGGSQPDSMAGSVIGTPGYMAPEQAAGRRDLDERADLYALGCTLYEMLAGRAAVDADSNAEKIRHTLDGTIVPLDEYTWVPAPLVAICQRAMAPRREERYPNAIELIADVESFLEGRPVGAQDEGWFTRLGRYYTSRAPRSMRLRFVDIDTLAASSLVVGIALGAWGAPWLEGWEWLVLALGALLGVPFYRTWFRRQRPDDPTSVPVAPQPLAPTTDRRPDPTAVTRRAVPPSDEAHATTLDQSGDTPKGR